MAEIDVYNLNKVVTKRITISDDLFCAEINAYVVNDAIRVHFAKLYENKTANCKTRSEVQGTRKKIYKQKGTGQARHGDSKAPIFVGGGKAHGPKPRIVVKKINKKAMRVALASAFSDKFKNNKIFVIENLGFESVQTKFVSNFLKKFEFNKNTLFVNGDGFEERNFNLSSRNIPTCKVVPVSRLGIYDLVKSTNLIFSLAALKETQERFIK